MYRDDAPVPYPPNVTGPIVLTCYYDWQLTVTQCVSTAHIFEPDNHITFPLVGVLSSRAHPNVLHYNLICMRGTAFIVVL